MQLTTTLSLLLCRLAISITADVPDETHAEDMLDAEEGDGEIAESIDLSSCFSPPLICPSVNVTFHLYTRSTTDYRLNVEDENTLKNAPFIEGKPYKILIHGYTGHKDFQPNDIRPALLAHDNYNVISVDWGKLSASPCYIQATRNVELAGSCTAQMVSELLRVREIPFNDIHVIGFSLGAQVSGQVAKYLKPKKLRRITGLDPAMPLFATLRRSSVLDRTDAFFVDIIHTNSGNKGKYGPNGHADFYVNGGRSQRGCVGPEVYDSASCSHARAPMYYAESITSESGFWGLECRNWFSYQLGVCSWAEAKSALMGEFADPTVSGQFFLDTNPAPPFALGLEGIGYMKSDASIDSN